MSVHEEQKFVEYDGDHHFWATRCMNCGDVRMGDDLTRDELFEYWGFIARAKEQGE